MSHSDLHGGAHFKAIKYLQDVASGNIVVGKYVRLAVERHFGDLSRADSDPDFPFFFDEARGARAISIFERQRLALGAGSGKPFILMPWQAAIVFLLYGWREKASGLRRFKKLYIKVARGNAKTEFLAGVANMAFLFEGVKDPQVFWLATKREQAKIGFMRQYRMLQMLCEDYITIRQRVRFSASKIFERGGAGFVMPLGKESKTEDGFSPYCVCVDEYHAHPTDDLLHVMESGLVKHVCPLLAIITTAGYNPLSPCAVFEEKCKKMLSGVGADQPYLLAFIYDLDEGDDWMDESVWIKANPSLGVSVSLESLRVEAAKANSEGGSKASDFACKNLNVWVRASKTWIPDDVFWSGGQTFDEDLLIGRVCYGGLDLSRSRDITALALFFPAVGDGEQNFCIFRFWCPRANAEYRARVDAVPYLTWASEGWMTLTDGDVIDTEFIYSEIIRLKSKFSIHSIAYDRWRALELVHRLNEEFGPQAHTQTKDFMEPFTQNTAHYHAPMVEFEKMVWKRKLNHGCNPVFRWMLGNVHVAYDANGNMRPDRKWSKEKIDGVVALLMAIGQFITYGSSNARDYYSPDVDVFVL